jgi:hypothetical protein
MQNILAEAYQKEDNWNEPVSLKNQSPQDLGDEDFQRPASEDPVNHDKNLSNTGAISLKQKKGSLKHHSHAHKRTYQFIKGMLWHILKQLLASMLRRSQTRSS